MSEHRSTLERELDRLSPPRIPFDQLARRRDRKRRNERIRAGVLGLAVAIAVGWLGVSVIRSSPPVPGGEPPPETTTNATCADSQDGPPPRVCFGPLEQGTYTSQRFEPALTFTVPAGWNNPWDTRSGFGLWAPGWSDNGADQGIDCRSGPSPCGYLFDQPGLSVRRDPRPEQGCSGYADATVGTSALEVATWVANHPAIATEGPSPVDVAGLTGYLLDVSLADTWRESCPGGPAAVWLFEDLYLNEDPGHATMRLILLDLPDGGSVLIAIDGTQVDVAMQVVRSFAFDLD
jgi:hypothetical protein